MSDTPPPKPVLPRPIDPRSGPLAPFTAPERRRWVGWNYEWRSGKNGKKGKWTKPPRQANGRLAYNNNPATWCSFDEIWPLVVAGKFDGIGFELMGLPGTMFVAIDLDDVVDPNTGKAKPWAAAIIAAAGSFTEITPSQVGYRIQGMVRAGTPALHCKTDHPGGGSFELYVEATRYITVSGHRLEGAPAALNDITDAVMELAALRNAKARKPKSAAAKPDDADSTVDADAAADTEPTAPIDLTTISPIVAELIRLGTEDGQPIKRRGKRFFDVIRYLHGKGQIFAAVLATLQAHPGGVHSKYAGRLPVELQRVWDKLGTAVSTMPTIRVLSGRRHEAAEAGLAALAQAGVPFYQRDKALVRIARSKAKASDGAILPLASVISVGTVMLGRALGQSARWEKVKATGEIVAIDPPKEVVEQIAAMTDQWPFPPLRSLIDTPTLRADGSLLQTPGYDPASGYYLFNPPPMPPIPERPTMTDALEALALLSNDLLDEFPFVNNTARAVAMSMLLTPVLRAALPVVPMHVVTAPEAGTGKSYLADIASVIATGDRCAVMAVSDKAEETEKRLIGAALAQFPIIALDNISTLLFGDFLCQATERTQMQLRPLGTSVLVCIANTFTVFANGNNLIIAADNVRRCIQCALDANMETPEQRTFAANPVRRVLADRGKYVAACLTIARAYIAADRPRKLPPLASYEEWSDLIRSALVWLNWPDPVETIGVIRRDDPVRQQRTAVFAAWADALTPAVGYLTAEVIANAETWVQNRRLHPELFAALFAVANSPRGGTQQIDPMRLGLWLLRNLDTVADGWKLTVDRSDRSRPRWKLETP
jgi:hypothetical protein